MSKYPILYKGDAADFFTLGLGPIQMLKASVTQERNGIFIFEGEILTDSPLFPLVLENYLIKADADHLLKDQRFRIKRIVPNHDGKAEIYAEHVSYLSRELTIKPEVSITGSAQTALSQWKASIVEPNPFVVDSDIPTNNKTKWRIDKVENPRMALGGVEGSILDVWGGEYRFDNYHISLLQKRGTTAKTVLAYGRNITDFEQERNIANTYTSIMPYAIYTDDKENEIVVHIDGYAVDSEHINKYPNRVVQAVNFSSEFQHHEVPTKARLLALANQYIKANEIGVPSTSIKVSFVDLSKSPDYAEYAFLEQVNLCDDVRVYYPKLGVNTVAKVIRTVWNVLTESYDEIEIGQKRMSLVGQMQQQQQAIKEINTQTNYAMTSADGKNTIFYGLYGENGLGEPKAIKVGDTWYKPNGTGTDILVWTGTIWKVLLDAETFNEINEKIDQAEKDIAQNIIDIESALDKATQAELDAGFSKTLAEEAKALGVTASSLAGEAKTNASTAMTDAEEALRQVELNEGVVADSSADSAEARRLASLAEANAQEAKTNASTAMTDAEEALRQVALNGGVAADANAEAAEARRLAGLAEGSAQEALTKANTAVTDSSTALTNATKAFNKSIKSSAITYTTSTNGSTPPTTGWGTTVPSPSPDVYIWTRTTIVLNDNTPVVSYSVGKIGAKGDQGLKGDTGGQGIQGVPGANAPTIKSVVQLFYLSTSKTSQTGGSWLTTVPVWSSGKYYWVRVVTTYSNNATSQSTPVLDNALNDSLITALEVKTANQTLSTTVTQHATLIEGKASSTTVDAITGRVTTAEGSISTIAGQVALKASTTDVNTLTGRVTTAEGNITTQAGQIALRATTATVNTLTGRVSTAEGKITTQAGLIELKADTTTVNTLTGRVSAAEASLSVQSGKIDLAATKTELTTAIDGIEVGGRNLLVESNFIQNNALTNQSGEPQTEPHYVPEAVLSSKIYVDRANQITISRKPGTIGSRNGLLTDHLMFVYYDEQEESISYNHFPSRSLPITVTIPEGTHYYLTSSSRQGLYDLKQEFGNKATDWTPAPEDVDKSISTVQANLTVEAGKIALKASQTSVDTLTGRVGTAETNISSNTTAINLRATKTSVDTLTGRVTTAEGSITTQAGQIALKASQTSVDSLTGRVSTAETNISANSTAINLRATKTELTTAIDGIEIGGRNLVLNTQGEHEPNLGGFNIYKLPLTSSSMFLGKELTFSFKAKSSNGTNRMYISIGTGGQSWNNITGHIVIPKDYKEFKYTFTSTTNTDTTTLMIVAGTNWFPDNDGSITITDIKLEKGNKATDWTPAPEDVDTAIASVQSNLTVEAGKITALTTRVSGSETNISNVTQTVSGINTTISTLRTDVNGKATIVSLNSVKSTADGNKTTISDHAGRLTTVETTVSGLQTTVSNKADKTTVTQLATSVELKATKTDVTALTGRVSTAEGSITTQAGQIALMATTATVNTLTGRVSTAEGKITANATAINLRATKTELNTAIDGIEVGGRNYALDSGRENVFNGFALFYNLSEVKHELSGANAIVSFEARHEEGSSPVNPHVYYRTGSGSNLGMSYGDNKLTTTSYQRFVIPIDNSYIPTDMSDYVTITVRKNDNSTRIYVRNVKLERGNKATSWTPAPEDVDKAIATVQSNLTVEAGKITALTTKTNGHTTQIGTLQTSYNGLSSTVTALETGKVGTVEFSALEQNLSGFKTTVQDTYADKTTVTALATQWTQTTELANGHTSEISSLGTAIDLRVTKADLIGEINVSAGKTIIRQSDNVLMVTSTTTYIQSSTIKTAHIEDLAVSGAKIANASITSAKIVSLDASKISVGTLTGHTINGAVINGGTITQSDTGGYSLKMYSGKLDMYRDSNLIMRLAPTYNAGTLKPNGAAIIQVPGEVFSIGTQYTNNATFNYVFQIPETSHAGDIQWNLFGQGNDIKVSSVNIGSDGAVRKIFADESNNKMRIGSDHGVIIGVRQVHGGYYDVFDGTGTTINLHGGGANTSSNRGAGISFGRDGGTNAGGARIWSLSLYQRTYSSAANMYITTDGTIGRAVSARKYKTDIQSEHLLKAKTVLQISPSSWHDRVELTNEKATKRHYGFIADEFHELGLTEVVQYGSDGQVEGLAYDRISMYHNVILQDHEQQLKRLDSITSNVIKLVANDSIYGLRLNNLESEVFRLKKRIEELEKIA